MPSARKQSTKPTRSMNPRGQSCLPCRMHKVQCDRLLPCKACIRHGREDACRKNPSPAVLGLVRQSKSSFTRIEARRPLEEALQTKYQPVSLPDAQVQNNGFHPTLPYSPLSTPSQVCSLDAPSISTIDVEASYEVRPELQSVASLQNFNEVAEFCRPGQTLVTSNGGGVSREPMNLSPSTIRGYPAIASSGLNTYIPVWQKPDADSVRIQLAALLPLRLQCDLLMSYFLDNLDFIHRAIHVPTFQRQYQQFWTIEVLNIDLIWLSLLLVILATSALRIPSDSCQALGFDPAELRKAAHALFNASELALRTSDCDTRPTLMSLQTFVISKLYYLMTNAIETLNSSLGRAVRNAQALGLHKPSTSPNILEREMRHRIWWEICYSDTFQSMCLTRPSLVQSHLSQVPFPLHCNNIDIGESSVNVRPNNMPTDLSLSICKFRLFKSFNKLYKEDCSHLQSLDFVSEVDAELKLTESDFPWFYQIENVDKLTLKIPLDTVSWGYHLLHSCMCMQRLRMYRPFLQTNMRSRSVYQKCLQAAESALDIYRALRRQDLAQFRRSPKFRAYGYQTFSVATFLSMLLLIERPPSQAAERIRSDVEMILSDLEYSARQENNEGLPVEVERCGLLRRIAKLCDESEQLTKNGTNETNTVVAGVYAIFGGETSSRSYLAREGRTESGNDHFHGNNADDRMNTMTTGEAAALYDTPTSTSDPNPVDDSLVMRSQDQPPGASMYLSSDSGVGDVMPSDLWQWSGWDQWDSLFGDSFGSITNLQA